MIVGVTGGMGAGKSLVAGLLGKLLGVEVLSADILCRNLLQQDMPGWRGIQNKWGNRFFAPDGNVDRPVLRKVLFDNPEVRQEIEKILHPLVRQAIMLRAEETRGVRAGLVVEVPLLFEVGWQNDYDWVVVVYADQECCIHRIVMRDKVGWDDGWRAVHSQISLKEKVLLADSVIDNSGPLALTILQIYQLVHFLERLS